MRCLKRKALRPNMALNELRGLSDQWLGSRAVFGDEKISLREACRTGRLVPRMRRLRGVAGSFTSIYILRLTPYPSIWLAIECRQDGHLVGSRLLPSVTSRDLTSNWIFTNYVAKAHERNQFTGAINYAQSITHHQSRTINHAPSITQETVLPAHHPRVEISQIVRFCYTNYYSVDK